MPSFTLNRFPDKNLPIDSLFNLTVECIYLNVLSGHVGVGRIFSRGALADFSRGSHEDFFRRGQKW